MPRAPGASSLLSASGGGGSGRAAAICSAVLIAVPEGASALPSWCSSMISTCGRKRAASAANRIISTAPMAKFGAINPPRACRSACAWRAAICSAVKPVVPITGCTPVSMMVRALSLAQEGCVKSTTTCARVAAMVPARSSPRSVCATSSVSGSAVTAATTWRPMRPLAPFTNTRIGILPPPYPPPAPCERGCCASDRISHVASMPPRVL